MSRFVANEAGIRSFFTNPEGPVGIYLTRRMQSVEQRAHDNVNGGTPSGHPQKRTGDLDSHIRSNLILDGDRLMALIGVSEDIPGHSQPEYPRTLERGGLAVGGKTSLRAYPWLKPALAVEFGYPPDFGDG